MTARSWYDVLGVQPGIGQAELRRAYRAAVRHWHPDLNHEPGAAVRFSQVLRAWEVLGDPARRADYDAARRSAARRPGPYRSARGGTRDAGSAPPRVVFVRRRSLPLVLWRLLVGRARRDLR